MKYKKGDKVRVKSQKWYDENKNKYGIVNAGDFLFQKEMCKLLGKEFTIKEVHSNFYKLEGYIYGFSDEMFEDSTELNIVEKLKDCPKGTKLYCTFLGEVILDYVSEITIVVKNHNCTLFSLTKIGTHMCGDDNAECVLFPSKENRDWSTFEIKPDLEINTPCVVFDRFLDNGKPCKPQVRDYAGYHRVYSYNNNLPSPSNPFNYIIPHYKYDFKNKSFKKEDNYGLNKSK